MTVQEKYANYSFEGFLQDDFFMESVRRPTEESSVFWKQFLTDYPAQTAVVQAARQFLEEMERPCISDEEVAEIWDNTQKKIKSSRKWAIVKKIAYSAVAIAASIAALIAVHQRLSRRDVPVTTDAIMAFVDNNRDLKVSNEEVQLILSDEKTIYVQGKETVITYDSASINTGSEQLSKNEASSYNRLIVPYGRSTLLTLHDGTKIWVNAGTQLVYPTEFEPDKREIYVNGELFIDVSPDAQRPFIVRTDEIRIEVLGTRFNVQAYRSDEQSRIALESGLVKITSKTADNVMLNPNQLYEQDKSGHLSVTEANVEKYTSWIRGLYIYESERLDVILKRLERYYGKEIVSGPNVAELRCSGKLDLKENVEDVLSTICMTAPVEYKMDEEKYIVNYQPYK